MIALCVIVEVFVSLNLETDTIRYNKSVNHDFCFLFFFRPCQEEERQEGNNRRGGRLIVHLMTIKSFTFKCCIE